jgi:hypothetical protein
MVTFIVIAVGIGFEAALFRLFFGVYALPFMVLCARLHKTIYVTSRNMWPRQNRRCF